MTGAALPFRRTSDGILLTVKLTPRATREEIGPVVADAAGRPMLSVRVASPPVDGAANKALIRALSKRLGLAKSAITITSGQTSRIKQVALAGEASEIEKALRACL